jgi:hypothetical protein
MKKIKVAIRMMMDVRVCWRLCGRKQGSWQAWQVRAWLLHPVETSALAKLGAGVGISSLLSEMPVNIDDGWQARAFRRRRPTDAKETDPFKAT